MMDKKTIGARLRKARGNKKIVTVARDIGVSPSAISNYELGFRIPQDKIKVKLANYYSQRIESLFF